MDMQSRRSTELNNPSTFQFWIAIYAGWVNSHQNDVIAYLQAELAVTRELLPKKRMLLNDAQRARLARAAKKLTCAARDNYVTIFTPATVLGWFRKLVAAKYDSSKVRRKPGRPAKPSRSETSSSAWRSTMPPGATCASPAPCLALATP